MLDSHFSGIRLSRSFGHQAALSCGYEFAPGDAVVSIDADMTSLILAIILIGTFILLMLGILGEYVGRIYTEVKGRPFFLVDQYCGRDVVISLNETGNEPRP
jgi:glycosyltransferase involved in cell wall biosynthesis